MEEKGFQLSRQRRNEILTILRQAIPVIAKTRRDEIDKLSQFAKLCVYDSFQGRLFNGYATNSKKDPLTYQIFTIQTSSTFFRLILSACAFHTISVFFEPDGACSSSLLYRSAHIIVVLLYLLDVSFKMAYEGIAVRLNHILLNLVHFS